MSFAGAICNGQRVRLGSLTSNLSRPDLQALSAGQHARRCAAPYRMDVRMGSTGKFFVGGNWKANGTKESVSQLVSGLNSARFPSDVEVIVAPIFLHLPYVVENIDSRYQVSAQNCWVGRAGAYTGEVCSTAVPLSPVLCQISAESILSIQRLASRAGTSGSCIRRPLLFQGFPAVMKRTDSMPDNPLCV